MADDNALFDNPSQEEEKFFEQPPEEAKTEPSDAEIEADRASRRQEAPEEDKTDDETSLEGEGEKSVKPPKGFVDKRALDAERYQRKELAEQLRQSQEQIQKFQQLQEELKAWREQQRKTQETSEEEEMKRLWEENPAEYLRRQNEKVHQEIREFKGETQSTREAQEQAQQAQQAIQQIRSRTHTLEEQFRQEHPDYDKAFQFVHDRQMQVYDLLGVTDPAQKEEAFYKEVMGLCAGALDRGQNPAEILYNLASVWQYQPQEGSNEKGSDLENKVAAAQKGMQAATSLSQGGGAPQKSDNLSLTDIEKMDDAEFDQLWNELERDARGRH